MTTAAAVTDVSPVPEFSHEAFFYADTTEFLDGTTAFVREGLDRDEEVLVAVSGSRFSALREVFGAAPGLGLVDMAEVGANPARIIPTWRAFLDQNLERGRAVRGVGEPIWAGRSESELAECHQHESLLNLAFGDGPAWRLLCPYDVTALPGDVIEAARANHPVLVDGAGRVPSTTYHPMLATRALRGQPLPPPAEPPIELAFSTGELGSVRRLVHRRCVELGIAEDLAEDLILAVDEIAANSLLHGGGRGVLRVWAEPDALVCEVSDEGVIRNPLVGRVRPPLDRVGGRGLWLANQLCDLVQVRSSPAGTVVRLHARR
jgi:anti-sigma regulatory factor (Ser/Thr protein kinase)